MNILALTEGIWSMGEGKGTQSLFLLLQRLGEAGHRVIAFVPTGQTASRNSNGFEVQAVRIPLARLRVRNWLLNQVLTKLSWCLVNFIFFTRAFLIRRTFRPNVVYGSGALVAPATWAVGRAFKAPTVTRLYGTFLYGHHRKLLGRLHYLEELVAFKLPSRLLIVTNDGTRGDEVARDLGVPDDQVRFWVNGVRAGLSLPSDSQRTAARRDLGLSESGRILTAISRLVRWKRVDRIIMALPRVVERYPNTQLLVVGDGAEREELEELARSLGVDPDIRFAGAVAQSEIRKFLWASDIFVSMHDVSNVSSSFLQAMSVGLPIITLDTGGTRDFVRDRYNGIVLHSTCSPDCLSDAIIGLLEDPKPREILSRNATAFAREHFRAWEDRIEEEVKEIERVASQSLSEERAE